MSPQNGTFLAIERSKMWRLLSGEIAERGIQNSERSQSTHATSCGRSRASMLVELSSFCAIEGTANTTNHGLSVSVSLYTILDYFLCSAKVLLIKSFSQYCGTLFRHSFNYVNAQKPISILETTESCPTVSIQCIGSLLPSQT